MQKRTWYHGYLDFSHYASQLSLNKGINYHKIFIKINKAMSILCHVLYPEFCSQDICPGTRNRKSDKEARTSVMVLDLLTSCPTPQSPYKTSLLTLLTSVEISVCQNNVSYLQMMILIYSMYCCVKTYSKTQGLK